MNDRVSWTIVMNRSRPTLLGLAVAITGGCDGPVPPETKGLKPPKAIKQVNGPVPSPANTMKPSPEAIAEAKRHPNGWVYQVEGNFGPNDRVPPSAIAGAWKVDGEGKIVGEFRPNPTFRGADGAKPDRDGH